MSTKTYSDISLTQKNLEVAIDHLFFIFKTLEQQDKIRSILVEAALNDAMADQVAERHRVSPHDAVAEAIAEQFEVIERSQNAA